MVWGVTLSVLVAVAAVAVFVATRRLRVSMSLQAAASEDGQWAIAGGSAAGPLAASGARMQDGQGAWAIHLFGKRVLGSSGAANAAAKDRRPSKLARRAIRFAREIDPAVATELAVDAFGRVRVESIDVRVRGGDPDPLVMGRVAGVLAVVSGVLAPVARIDAQLDWAAEESSLDVRIALEVTFVPVVVGFDVSRFALHHILVHLRARLGLRTVPAPERA